MRQSFRLLRCDAGFGGSQRVSEFLLGVGAQCADLSGALLLAVTANGLRLFSFCQQRGVVLGVRGLGLGLKLARGVQIRIDGVLTRREDRRDAWQR